MRRSWSIIVAMSSVFALLTTSPLSVRDADAQDPYIGEIRWVGFNFAPPGWHLCDGQLLQISQFTAVFALLGTQFGGDGKTTFALPDLRGRVVIGQGPGPGLTPRSIGDAAGDEAITLTVNQMPTHSHPAMASSNTASSDAPGGRVLANATADGPDPKIYSSGQGNVALGASTIGSVGGGEAQNNMPPFVTLNCIIALQGIFPSRQ